MKRIPVKSGIEANTVGMGTWAIGGVTYAPVFQGSGAFSSDNPHTCADAEPGP